MDNKAARACVRVCGACVCVHQPGRHVEIASQQMERKSGLTRRIEHLFELVDFFALRRRIKCVEEVTSCEKKRQCQVGRRAVCLSQFKQIRKLKPDLFYHTYQIFLFCFPAPRHISPPLVALRCRSDRTAPPTETRTRDLQVSSVLRGQQNYSNFSGKFQGECHAHLTQTPSVAPDPRDSFPARNRGRREGAYLFRSWAASGQVCCSWACWTRNTSCDHTTRNLQRKCSRMTHTKTRRFAQIQH